MFIIICLFIALTLYCRSCGWPGALAAFGAIFAIPIVAFPLLRVGFAPQSANLEALAFVLLAIWVLSGRHIRKLRLSDLQDELPALALFCLSLIFAQLLCFTWPDFVSIGERLRDYAILAATIDSPSVATEPWMSGATLNYYVYWYRFGALLSQFGRLEVWNTYHLLAAFSIASYCAMAYLCGRIVAKFSISGALASAIIIAAGSNFDGLMSVFEFDKNWWRPSRVILGAINEFPAWSFILGDLHPHFTNLVFFPFALCAIALVIDKRGKQVLVPALLLALLLFPLFIYNANAWELPIWLGFIFTLLATSLVVFDRSDVKSWIAQERPLFWRVQSKQRFEFLAYCGTVIYLCVSLWLSSRNISPAHDALTFVRHPIASSRFSELFKHWGLPFGLMSLAVPALLSGWRMRLLGYVAIGLSILVDSGSTLVMTLFVLNALRVLARRVDVKSADRLILDALSIAALGLILTPEILFFNDPYGGENERMNTIFKIYAATWCPIHLCAFAITRDAWLQVRSKQLRDIAGWIAQPVLMILMLLFFRQAAALRMQSDFSIEPKSQGLSSVDREFPGSAATIQFLEKLPRSVILEGQGNPYSYTTHVATLSGHDSYLGWANHVGLLTRNNEEVQRRERISEQIYTLVDCAARRSLVLKEGINFVIVGPLEQQKYAGAQDLDYGCLKLESQTGGYRVYSP